MRRFCAPLAVLAALCCAPHVIAEEPLVPQPPPQEEAAGVDLGGASDVETPPRMCFGGYEDGKIVVSQGRVRDATVETTAKACRIDGGSDARAPQSPLLTARRFAVLV